MTDYRLRRARKDHKCIHCGWAIPQYSEYYYAQIPPWEQVDYEDFYTYKAHVRCHAFWLEVGQETDWFFWDDPIEWRRAMFEAAEAREMEQA